MTKGKVRLTLRRGDPGTKRWAEQYGEKLVSVRYRYDREELRCYTTVELIVDERPWHPEPPLPDADRLVGVRVAYQEEALRRSIRTAGGQWDAQTRLWWLPLHTTVQLGLQSRIARQTAPARLQISSSR